MGTFAPTALPLQPYPCTLLHSPVSALTTRSGPSSPFLQFPSALVANTRKDHHGQVTQHEFAKQRTIGHVAWGQRTSSPAQRTSKEPASTRGFLTGSRESPRDNPNPSMQRGGTSDCETSVNVPVEVHSTPSCSSGASSQWQVGFDRWTPVWGGPANRCTQCRDQQQYKEIENDSPAQSKPTQNPACSKHHCLPSGCSGVAYVQFRPSSNSRSSPNTYSERRLHPHGDLRHQSQSPAFNFSSSVSPFSPLRDGNPRAVGERSQAMENEEQERCRQGTRPLVAVSPPKHGKKVAIGGTSQHSGHMGQAALLEQSQTAKLSALSRPQTSTQTNVSFSNKLVEGIN